MQPHSIVSQEEWTAARKALLAREKELTRARDRLSEARRALPWVRVEKAYGFNSVEGNKSLADLFKGRDQLVVQHFMFAPDWNELFVLGGWFRAHGPASGGPRHHAGGGLTRPAREARRFQETDGMDLRLGIV